MSEAPTISFCAIEREDLNQLRDQRNKLMRNFRQYKFLNMINQEDWFMQISRSDEHIMMGVENNDSDLVGVVGLTYIDWVRRNAESSIYIFAQYGDKGYGKAALRRLLDYGFGSLAMHRIYAEIWSFNSASIRLFESCGFLREGISRHAVMDEGKWHDSIWFSILEDEWRSLS